MPDKSPTFFDLQGHRGCRGLMPENTIPAMLRALELGVTTLEMDVSITADEVCILSHEPFFNHDIATRPDGSAVKALEQRGLNIFRMTYEEVARYDVGMRPHPNFPEQKKMPAVKPRLSDVFAEVKRWCAANQRPWPFFNIETKTRPISDGIYHPGPERFTDLLMQVVNDAGMTAQTTIQSFDYRTLQYLHKSYPGVSTSALVEQGDKASLEKQISRLGFVPTVYSPHHKLVDASLVQQCHARGIRLVPWTVNDSTRAHELMQLGVDGLITDYPDRIGH